jgi:amino acid permease
MHHHMILVLFVCLYSFYRIYVRVEEEDIVDVDFDDEEIPDEDVHDEDEDKKAKRRSNKVSQVSVSILC